MNTTEVTEIGRQMLYMSMLLAGPVIIIGMVAGLVVSIFQTVTQIQEQSVSFVLKILAACGAILFMAPWMLRRLSDFTSNFLGDLSQFVR